MNERDAVTNEQGEDGEFHLRWDYREHLSYNINQKLNEDKKTRPRMSTYRGNGRTFVGFLCEGEDEEAVDGHKTAIVNHKKRREK